MNPAKQSKHIDKKEEPLKQAAEFVDRMTKISFIGTRIIDY